MSSCSTLNLKSLAPDLIAVIVSMLKTRHIVSLEATGDSHLRLLMTVSNSVRVLSLRIGAVNMLTKHANNLHHLKLTYKYFKPLLEFNLYNALYRQSLIDPSFAPSFSLLITLKIHADNLLCLEHHAIVDNPALLFPVLETLVINSLVERWMNIPIFVKKLTSLKTLQIDKNINLQSLRNRLPPNLLHFVAPNARLFNLQSMPRGLITLHAFSLPPPLPSLAHTNEERDVPCLSLYFPSLTSLRLEYFHIGIELAWLDNLPSGLEILQLILYSNVEASNNDPVFAKFTEYFDSSSRAQSSSLPPPSWVPSALKTLNLTHSLSKFETQENPAPSYNLVSVTHSRAVFYFCVCISQLERYSIPSSTDIVFGCVIPPRIMKIEIHTPNFLELLFNTDSSALSCLEELVLLRYSSPSDVVMPDAFQFPFSLKTLRIEGDTNEKLFENMIQRLSQLSRFETLSIPQLAGLLESFTRHGHRLLRLTTLIVLHDDNAFGTTGFLLPQDFAKCLPRGLRSLCAGSLKIPIDDFLFLPPDLKRLEIGLFFQHTNDEHHHLLAATSVASLKQLKHLKLYYCITRKLEEINRITLPRRIRSLQGFTVPMANRTPPKRSEESIFLFGQLHGDTVEKIGNKQSLMKKQNNDDR